MSPRNISKAQWRHNSKTFSRFHAVTNRLANIGGYFKVSLDTDFSSLQAGDQTSFHVTLFAFGCDKRLGRLMPLQRVFYFFAKVYVKNIN